ncbi:MAG: hypothetical protein OEM15_07585 [Myxococcales bacterium]|nr:hypothetical protein [Myxococcales bacterium]MDH3484670.1 hypothetical protein [Myxococcales bacterium]
MRRGLACVLLGASLLGGCSGKSSCHSAAAPHIDEFDELRHRALNLLEFRAVVERRRLLLRAQEGDEESLPPNLKPVFKRMRQERITLTAKEVAEGEASFWRMLELMFSENENILQGEIVFIEKDESTTVFRHPPKREVPAGLRWHGLRQHRTYCAVADCLVDDGIEPCVLVQLRPRDYSGSAGLTVGFKRNP